MANSFKAGVILPPGTDEESGHAVDVCRREAMAPPRAEDCAQAGAPILERVHYKPLHILMFLLQPQYQRRG